MTTWLARTKQRWKMTVGFVALGAAGVLFVVGIRLLSQCTGPAYAYCAGADASMIPMLTGTGLGLLAFAWLGLAVRCGRCGKRIVWWAMASQPSGRTWTALLTLQACPRCGDRGGGQLPPENAGFKRTTGSSSPGTAPFAETGARDRRTTTR